MKNEKRIIKTYKIKESVYKKAKKRADRNGKKLATMIEDWITRYVDSPVFFLTEED